MSSLEIQLGPTADIHPHYLAVDPGKGSKRTIGVFAWNSTPEPVHQAQYTREEFDEYRDLLERLHRLPSVIIIERYVQFGHVPHKGSKHETSQVIGAVKDFARRHGIRLVEQSSSILPTASLWSGVKLPKGHLPDWKSAYLHGYYYLSRQNLIKPRVLERIEKNDS